MFSPSLHVKIAVYYPSPAMTCAWLLQSVLSTYEVLECFVLCNLTLSHLSATRSKYQLPGKVLQATRLIDLRTRSWRDWGVFTLFSEFNPLCVCVSICVLHKLISSGSRRTAYWVRVPESGMDIGQAEKLCRYWNNPWICTYSESRQCEYVCSHQ